MENEYTAKIREALKDWYADDKQQPGPVMESIIEALKQHVEVITPVYFPGEDVEELDPDTLREGDTFVETDEMQLEIQRLETEDGKYYYAVFTDLDEMKKGEETATISSPLNAMMYLAGTEKDCAGLAINPWDNNIKLPGEVCLQLLDAARPVRKDEELFQLAMDAYYEEDFEEAIKNFTAAADEGNVTALAYLGICYFYGRGMEMDREKAHLCFEKAGLLGDIMATIMLGDMFRNGDLPIDIAFSVAMYQQAYETAKRFMDNDNYPDACLRIAKYCSDDMDQKEVSAIAEEAAEGFKRRMDDGDPFAEVFYWEALELVMD